MGWTRTASRSIRSVTGAPPDLMFNMLLATGVLIGTVVVLVIVSFAWYRKAEEKRLEQLLE